MVRRSVPHASARGDRQGVRAKKREGGVQRSGELMLNNPLIPPELDEDIDDDLAFNSDDERLYGHLFAQKAEEKHTTSKKTKLTKRKKGRQPDSDSEEDHVHAQLEAVEAAERTGKHASRRRRTSGEEEEDLYNYHEDGQSSDGEDYVDLSDMLDMSLKAQKAKAPKKPLRAVTEDGRSIAKKRRGAAVTAEAESLYGTAAAGADGGVASYSAALRDFVRKEAPTEEERAAQRRLERALHNKRNLLSVDADEPTKHRLTRKEVRTVVGENLDKYKSVLRELTTSKHVQLPMPLPESMPTPSSIGAVVAAAEARFRDPLAPVKTSDSNLNQSAAGRFSRTMGALLSQAGLTKPVERDRADVEESAMGDHVTFDPEDDAPGQASAPTTSYMAKLKAMLSYENHRRRRFNRIKSKTYRRILRKEQDRERERRQKAFELLHPERARQRLAEKLLKTRAEERVTQKHKNTSAWVKHAKRFAAFDGNTKDAIQEQLSLHQKRMRKMEEEEAGEGLYGHRGDDAASEASSEEDRVVDELLAKVANEKATAKPVDAKVAASALWRGVAGEEEEDGDGGADGVPSSSPMAKARADLKSMKFMKAAQAREEKAYVEQMEELQADIRRYQDGESLGASDVRDGTEGTARPKAARGARRGAGKETVETIQLQALPGLTADKDETRPPGGKRARPCEEAEAEASSTGASRAAVSEFAGDRPLLGTKKTSSVRVTIRPATATRAVETEGEPVAAPPAPASTEAEADALQAHQEYLISRAFAQDDVDEDFLKAKESQVEMIMKPTDKNEALPGWGEWGGEDARLNQRHQAQIAHQTMQKQIEKSFLLRSRADASLDHVIINHDGVELVPDRMTLHMVPRPFSNAQEFARSMRQPVGPEWRSALSFKEGTQPRVEVRQGHAVLPLDLSLHPKKSKTKRRKVETTKK